MYEIAKYLSNEDKQRILDHRFIRRGEETGERDPDGLPLVYHGLVPVSADDQYCPLAYIDGIDSQPSAPGASTVASILFHRSDYYPYDESFLDTLEDAATEFIEDWDAGKISDIAEALGVAR